MGTWEPRAGKAAILMVMAITSQGCALLFKHYATVVIVPSAEQPIEGIALHSNSRGAAVITVEGLELAVGGQEHTISTWVSPYPLPPFIPIDFGHWPPPFARIYISFTPHAEGFTFLPAGARIEPEGEKPVAAVRAYSREGFTDTENNLADEVSLVRPVTFWLEFPIVGPLEGWAEIELELRRNGKRVRLPRLGLWPTYPAKAASVP